MVVIKLQSNLHGKRDSAAASGGWSRLPGPARDAVRRSTCDQRTQAAQAGPLSAAA